MPVVTRKPSGLVAWPITLIAGKDKAGKSWMCAEASASDLIDRTFFFSIGETDPDEYGVIPGVRFEIVEHDGTFEGILQQVTEAVLTPPEGDKKNLLVIDSHGLIWAMLTDYAQGIADSRARARHGGELPDYPIEIPNDVWSRVKASWQDLMKVIRLHDGPVLLTARLDSIVVPGKEDGEPDRKVDKVKAEKNLAYDVDAVIEMPARGEVWISGVRSATLKLAGRERYDDLTIDGLWRLLGLDKNAASRRYTELRPRVTQQGVAA